MGNKNSAPKKTLSDTVIDVKLAKKRLDMAAKRSEKDQVKEKAKVVQAIKQGNVEGARIFAQNAIRKKHESLNYLKLAAKMDALASQLDSANKSNEMTHLVSSTVPQLNGILDSISPEEIASNMERFEKIFEDFNVRTDYANSAIDSTTAQTTPQGEVDSLLTQIGEAEAIDVSSALDPMGAQASVGAAMPLGPKPAAAQTAGSGGGKNEEDEISRRLEQLRA